jgi:phage gp45-like
MDRDHQRDQRGTDVSEETFRRIWAAIRTQVVRGKVVMAGYNKGGQRTMLQGAGFFGEQHLNIELMLPYGMSAIPAGETADYIYFKVNGSADHKVAVGADDPALRIPDLQAGEIGFRNNRGNQVVLRQNKIEVTAPLDDIDVTAAVGNINVAATAGNVAVTAAAGNISLAAAAGNVSVTASNGDITLSAKSITFTGIGGGNLGLNVTGNLTLGATGSVAISGVAGEITANGHVLG